MQNKIIYGLVAGTALMIALGIKIKQTDLLDRAPAAVSEPQKTTSILKPAFSEIYLFERKVKATYNTKVLADTHYSGYLIVNWLSITPLERTGRFSFTLKDGKSPRAFIEAKMTSDYRVLSLKEIKAQNADEEDLVSFTKDLVSIYAYQSVVDTTGKYQARIYETSKGIWLKKKLKYEDPKFANLKIEKSIHQIKLAQKSSGFSELSGVEETSLQAEAKQGFKTRSTYLLKRTLGKELATEHITASLGADVNLNDALLIVTPVFTTQTQIKWEDVAANMERAGTLSGNERLKWFHEVTQALKANPEKLAEFASWLKSNLSDPKKANFGIGVLATLGTPQSQRELVGIYLDSAGSPEKKALCHVILNAFATTDANATPETKEFLATQMRARENADLAINAAFAMGAEIQKEPNAEYEKQLAETAAQAKSLNEKLAYLDAMGNSGSVQFLPQITETLNTTDPIMREKAVFALRYMSDDRVTSILESAVKDPSLGVKISAVKAISYQKDITPYTQTLNTCSRSTEPRLRDLCAQTLNN